MHPLGFLIALMSHQQAAYDRARPRPEEPLPPIDDATLRAWRAWARGERPTTRPTPEQRPSAVPPYVPVLKTRAGQPG